jgi:hypothetical protein
MEADGQQHPQLCPGIKPPQKPGDKRWVHHDTAAREPVPREQVVNGQYVIHRTSTAWSTWHACLLHNASSMICGCVSGAPYLGAFLSL